MEGELLSEEEEDDEEDAEEEANDSDGSSEAGVDSITHCFYCGLNNREIENNIKHMFNKHGLYIPERSYLVDPSGLLEYLSEVISLDYECLVCGFEGKIWKVLDNILHPRAIVEYHMKPRKRS